MRRGVTCFDTQHPKLLHFFAKGNEENEVILVFGAVSSLPSFSSVSISMGLGLM